jgi:hypothetical protein
MDAVPVAGYSIDGFVTLLQTINWTQHRNHGRPHVSDDACFSVSFGRCFIRSQGYGTCAANAKYPEVFRVLQELMHRHNPQFTYSTINVNYNLLCKPHCDKNNRGDTYIVALGHFAGGELVVQSSDGRAETTYDIHNKWLRFNGNTLHWTLPFGREAFDDTSGVSRAVTRFSLVYYTSLNSQPISGFSVPAVAKAM